VNWKNEALIKQALKSLINSIHNQSVVLNH